MILALLLRLMESDDTGLASWRWPPRLDRAHRRLATQPAVAAQGPSGTEEIEENFLRLRLRMRCVQRRIFLKKHLPPRQRSNIPMALKRLPVEC